MRDRLDPRGPTIEVHHIEEDWGGVQGHILESMGPGMYAAVDRVVTAVVEGDLMVSQITSGRNLGALRQDNTA